MKRLGYTSGETDAVARQAAVISVVPQDNLKKSSFTKIGFVSLDDYHYASDDASNLTDYYELDCCENSCFGIIEREKEARKGRSRLFYIDNLLDYNSIEDKFAVWMGKTEKLHQMNAYIDLDYQNEFGTKSENGRNFGRMISRALQNAVSNSCRNYRSRELIELKTDDIFITEPAGFRQGNEQQNQGYISPQVENARCRSAAPGSENGQLPLPLPNANQRISPYAGLKTGAFTRFRDTNTVTPFFNTGKNSVIVPETAALNDRNTALRQKLGNFHVDFPPDKVIIHDFFQRNPAIMISLNRQILVNFPAY